MARSLIWNISYTSTNPTLAIDTLQFDVQSRIDNDKDWKISFAEVIKEIETIKVDWALISDWGIF